MFRSHVAISSTDRSDAYSESFEVWDYRSIPTHKQMMLATPAQ